MKVILTDIDDTLIHFADAFQQWAERRGMTCHGRLYDMCSIEKMLQCSREETDALLHEYAADGDAMFTIPAMADALYVLPLLHRWGYRLVAISSCVDGEEITRRRAEHLADLFGFSFDAVHCVGVGQSKDAVLMAYEPTIWVEDNPKHAIRGAALGHQSFLLARPYNDVDCGGALRVTGWHDVLEAVIRNETAARYKEAGYAA